MPLSEIPEFLGIKVQKEVFDYSLNTEDNFLDQYLSYDLIKDSGLREQIREVSKTIDSH